MPLFDYTGQLESGAAFQGTLEAPSREAAEKLLHEMHVRVTALRAARRLAYVAPLSLDDFLFLNEQIAAMAQAGVPFERGLRELAADVGSRKLKRLLLDLADDLEAGTSIDDALERQKRRFPTNYAEVVRAGLQTGDLGGALYGLTAQLRLKSSFQRSLIEMTVYPLVVLVLMFCVLSFAMRQIVPPMAEVYLDFGAKLPTATSLLISAARSWPAIEIGVGVVALVFAVFVIIVRRTPALREAVVSSIPGIGRVYWASVLSRFAHTTALGAYSGTPLPELIAAGGAGSGSGRLAAAARRLAERLQSGMGLEDAAREESRIPALWVCAVATAAPRGDLPSALQELARVYEEQAQHWASVVRIMLGPFLLAFVGLFLLFVVLSLFLPLISLVQCLSG